MLASTVKFRPRYLLIVRALAGDSTITKACAGSSDFEAEALRFAIFNLQTAAAAQNRYRIAAVLSLFHRCWFYAIRKVSLLLRRN
jgi:hypothetical protein